MYTALRRDVANSVRVQERIQFMPIYMRKHNPGLGRRTELHSMLILTAAGARLQALCFSPCSRDTESAGGIHAASGGGHRRRENTEKGSKKENGRGNERKR